MTNKKPAQNQKAKKSLLNTKVLKNTSRLKSIAAGAGAVTSQCHHTQMTCNQCGSVNC